MPRSALPDSHAANDSLNPNLAGPVRVSAAAAGRGRMRERPAGIAMSALAAGESVVSGLRHNPPGGPSALALSDGTRISFSRITGESCLEPA